MKTLSRADRLSNAINKLQEGVSELEELVIEYEDWQGNLPENLQSSATADKLEETVSALQDAKDTIESAIGDIEGIDLPLGFGRD
jgi:chromosome segregation ATPase